ncbi:MAG: xanthine dehydrogenase family protein molybdopterin-binding subunit [Candidatus Eiseniibacteriota bacterium]
MAETKTDGVIGRAVPRRNAKRLVAGRGRYVDDIVLPRMVHVAFVRSPVAHGRIVSIDAAEAGAMPGVVRVVTGRDLVEVCQAFQGIAETAPMLKSPPQRALAVERVLWQGEAIAAVIAESRARAEDAAERVAVDIEPLPAVVDPVAALEDGADLVHPALGTNLAHAVAIETGAVDDAFAKADHVVTHEFDFGRLTGVPLEPRGIVADFDRSTGSLTVHQSHQTPYQMQDVFARLLGIPEHNVQVICPDVGGAFGIKLHAYPDEIAVAAIATLLGRPVKYIADRLESFVADVHARDHRVTARIAVDKDGRLRALDVDDTLVIGAYSAYPRTSIGEGGQVVALSGAPYRLDAYRGRLRTVYQNKTPTSAYRAVGHPIAAAVTEQMVDLAAAEIGMDPLELRRRNFIPDDGYPAKAPGGMKLDRLSLEACQARLMTLMDYEALRAEQTRLRARGIYRGIGVATFVEITAPSAGLYGPMGVHVSAQDGCTLKLEPSGTLRCAISVTDQGQGTATGIAQIVADAMGLEADDVDVIMGDSRVTPYGGGAWASRGIPIGGETAHAAAVALRANVVHIAGALLQTAPDVLSLKGGQVYDAAGTPRLPLAEIARIGTFRQDMLPPDIQPELTVTRHYVPRGEPYYMANGVQACHLELDPETGFIKLLKHWVVEDCGRVINPLLVDEQIRGGVVQGLGAALYEHCQYDDQGQMVTATLLDYLVPMAAEMPEIVVEHVSTPARGTALGAKGAGEAGAGGAAPAVWCAVNDALRPLGARLSHQPFTPERVLDALAAARRRG